MCVDVTEGDKMNIRPIDANALKRYFSDEQMKYVSVDETNYTFNA